MPNGPNFNSRQMPHYVELKWIQMPEVVGGG